MRDTSVEDAQLGRRGRARTVEKHQLPVVQQHDAAQQHGLEAESQGSDRLDHVLAVGVWAAREGVSKHCSPLFETGMAATARTSFESR